MEQLAKAVKDADTSGVDLGTDAVGVRVRSLLAAGRAWVEKAKELQEALRVHIRTGGCSSVTHQVRHRSLACCVLACHLTVTWLACCVLACDLTCDLACL